MSFVQEKVLQEFLAGAYDALHQASSPDVASEDAAHEQPASIQMIRSHNTGELERHALPAISVPERALDLPQHHVVLRNAGLTTAFGISIPQEVLSSLPEQDRVALRKVLVHSELIESGIDMPAISVPPELRDMTMKIMRRTGLSANPDWHPYKDGAEYGTADLVPPPHIKAEPVFRITLNWDNFEKMGKALGRGIGRNDNE